MQQCRWVSYIFRYRNNLRCDNAGFIKVQRITSEYKVISSKVDSREKHVDMARIQIGIKMYKENTCYCKVYLMHRQENMAEPDCTFLEEIHFNAKERDTIVKKFELDWDNPLKDGVSFDCYDGVFFMCDDGEILAGMWNEYAFSPEQIRKGIENVYSEKVSSEKVSSEKVSSEKVSSEKVSPENVSQKKAGEIENQDNIKANDYHEEQQNPSENICQSMLNTFPKLPLFPDSQFMECVKIVPHDIGRLAMGNWKLGINSFLSHGYYHYRYIMMGKVKFERKEAYVIGVPGVYTNKEKYLANMFGFNIFIPVKRTKFLTGNFGYWISEIVTE